MPIYKGNTEIASGKLYKADTNIENGYKGVDSFYINEVTISFLNFPGVSDYSITGAPGESIPGNRYQQWTATASSGYAFNGTQTALGLPTDFTFTQGQQGSTSYTTTSPRVNYSPSTFPTSSVSVDYNNLTVSLPQTQVTTRSYTFTGNLGRSTSCIAFVGSSCTVSSASQFAGNFEYYTSNASGTGGYGANGCNQGCNVSISSSGGSSSCNTSGGTASQSASADIVAIPTYSSLPSGYSSFNSAMYCATVNSGSASSICGGYSVETQRPGQPWSGGGAVSSSCGTAPPYEINPPGGTNGYRLSGRSINGGDSGTWSVRIRNGSGQVEADDSTSMT